MHILDHVLGHTDAEILKITSIPVEGILLLNIYKQAALYNKEMAHLQIYVGPLRPQPII